MSDELEPFRRAAVWKVRNGFVDSDEMSFVLGTVHMQEDTTYLCDLLNEGVACEAESKQLKNILKTLWEETRDGTVSMPVELRGMIKRALNGGENGEYIEWRKNDA